LLTYLGRDGVVDTCSGVPRHSVISNWCKSFVFSTNLKLRVYGIILVRVSSCQIKNFKMVAKIQDGCQFPSFSHYTSS